MRGGGAEGAGEGMGAGGAELLGRRPLGGGRGCALLRLWRLRRKVERWRRAPLETERE
jgi:hypothetical protein